MKIDKKSTGLLNNILTWLEDAKILKLASKMKNF